MKRSLKIIALIMTLITAMGVISIFAGAEAIDKGRFGIVSTVAVSVYQEPKTDGKIIGGLLFGNEVIIAETVTADGKVWYKIEYNSDFAYILSQSVELIEDVGMVKAGSINIRLAPSASSVRVGGATKGKALNIINKVTENGKTWYKVYSNGITGYVDSDYVGIMSLPSTETVKADYNKVLHLKAKAVNLPKDYEFEFLGISAGAGPDGSEELVIENSVGQLKDSKDVYLIIKDENGVIKCEKSLLIEVNNGFFSVIAAYIGFIFNGFQWPSQVIEL